MKEKEKEAVAPPREVLNIDDLESSAEVIYKAHLTNEAGLDYEEFVVAARKLGILGSKASMKDLFKRFSNRMADKSQPDGRLTLKGFKDLIYYRMSLDMVEPVRILDATLTLFAKEDAFNSGHLSKSQLKSFYVKLGLSLTQAEQDALYTELDSNRDQHVSPAEMVKFFIKPFSHITSHPAKTALMKIRTTFSPSPIELYEILSKMPSNFFPSFTQELFYKAHNLPCSTLRPILQPNKLGKKNFSTNSRKIFAEIRTASHAKMEKFFLGKFF